MLKGIIPETFGMKKIKPNRSSFPDFDDKGWRGRFSSEVFGSKSRRSKIISELISDGYSHFQRNLELLATKIGVQIDPNVTMDIHRIFRLPRITSYNVCYTKLLRSKCFITDMAA